ncbi:MAG: helix-turn-helix domain-containing protein [Desulfovibrionaceae bacterium]
MDFISMTDHAVAKELGERLRTRRLRMNKTQEALAEHAGLSVSTIKKLENGNGQLSSLIAALRSLKSLDNLNAFLPSLPISPIQLSENKGKERKRASRSKKKPPVPDKPQGGHFILIGKSTVRREGTED